MFQGDVEAGLDLGTDAIAEGGEVGIGGAPAIDQGQGVAGGDAGVAENVAFAEAGVFDQPGGGELDAGAAPEGTGGPVGDLGGVEVELAGEVFEVGRGEDGVLEEGAGAARVGIARGEEHAFGAADLADGMVDLDRCGLLAGEAFGKIGVGEVGRGVGGKAEDDGGDDVAAAGVGVEEAGAVGKAAGFVGELGEGAGVEVEGADGVDGLGDLLPVGSDVLDGRGTSEAGDAGEALHAGEVEGARVENEGVPVEAGGDPEVDPVLAGWSGNQRVAESEMEDEAGETAIRDEEVGAAAEGEEAEVVGPGEGDGFEELGLGADLDEEAGWAADAEGGEGGEVDVFLNLEGGAGHGLRVQQVRFA